MTIKLNTSGKLYKVWSTVNTLSKEENESLRLSGKSYHTKHNTTLYYCNLLRDGKGWGATRVFSSDQISIIES